MQNTLAWGMIYFDSGPSIYHTKEKNDLLYQAKNPSLFQPFPVKYYV